MALFTVTTAADAAGDTSIGTRNPDGSYSGTLRQAINFANQTSVTDPRNLTTIDVAGNLSGGTITLAGNLPLVATSVTLNGNGVTLDGASAYRAFLVTGVATGNGTSPPPATTVNISALTIQNVVAHGGAGTAGGGGGLGAGGAVFVRPARKRHADGRRRGRVPGDRRCWISRNKRRGRRSRR